MRIKERFLDLFKNYWIFKYALLVHGFYLVLSYILVFTFYQNMNDFIIYYKVGEVFLHNINGLYDQANYLYDFRYLPLSALFFIPYSLLGSWVLGFIVFNIVNLILNVLICILIYKIILLVKNDSHEKDDKRPVLFICLYFMSLPHVLNYVLGQINQYITIFILLSLYLFIKYDELKWQFLGGVILGISIIIKPTSFFMMPFLIMIHYDLKERKLHGNFKKSMIRIIGTLSPIFSNLFIFLLYPGLLEGFIATNFTGSNPVAVNFSFSITKLIINFFSFYNIPFSQMIVLLIVMLTIGIMCFLLFLFKTDDETILIYGYIFGLLIMLLAYFDSWDHHLLNLTPLIVILIFILPRNVEIPKDSDITVKYIKPCFFFLCFMDLIFLGIYMLIQDWFPFNFMTTLVLLIFIYGLGKHMMLNDKD